MGKLKEGFTGGVSGRVGNTVGYQWRGKWCIRMRPAVFHDAKTPNQLAQRALFRQTVAFAGRAKETLRLGLRMASLEHQMTECNYFMRKNKRCFALEEGQLRVQYEELVFAEGPVAPVRFETPQVIEGHTLQIDFEKNPLRRTARPSDIVYVLLYCPDLEAFHLSLPTYRSKGRVEILLSDRWTGHEVHLWGFVQDNKGRASDSYYLGSGVLEEEFEDEWNAESDADLLLDEETAAGEVDMSDEGVETAPPTSSAYQRRAREGDGKGADAAVG